MISKDSMKVIENIVQVIGWATIIFVLGFFGIKGIETFDNSKESQVIAPLIQQTESDDSTLPLEEDDGNVMPDPPNAFLCNCSKTCSQMSSCSEAQYQLNTCSCYARDADDDGIACDAQCQ